MSTEITETEFGKFWEKNGLLHREDGPAIEYANGGKEYWVNGVWHRADAPDSAQWVRDLRG